MAALFAPILWTTQPAFAASNDTLIVYYTLPQVASLNNIKNIEVKINFQDTNSNVINNATGILSLSVTENSFTINKSSLKGQSWKAGKLYKIQARLVDSFDNKSEWSNVMITKAITPPQVKILNGEMSDSDINEISAVYSEIETMPTFYGDVKFTIGELEHLDNYKFDLYKDDKLIESSGTIQYNGSSQASPQYRFKQQLARYETYQVIFSIVSNNGYATTCSYNFEVISSTVGILDNLSINIDSTSIACIENAMIQVRLTSENQGLVGNYVIIRSDEDSNYQIWDDMIYLTYSGKQLNNELVFTDYFIDCGKRYKYAVQREQTNNARSEMLLPQDPSPHFINFEYSYLCGGGKQIKLNFNNNLDSFKHTQLVGKLDTLGSTYPTIAYNGHAYYAEFSLSGLISAYMDEENLFMDKDFDLLSINPTPNVVQIEREFRHKVESFLNDKKYKLFKTPTESNKNIIVGLTGVTLSSEKSLNRMLYSFSTTAYEVAENNIVNLRELGILSAGKWQDITTLNTQVSFGQVQGRFSSAENLMDKIIEQQETTTGNDHKYKIKSLRKLKITNNSGSSDIIVVEINGINVNIASGKEYVLTGLEDSNISSIYIKSPENIDILLDYTVDRYLEKITIPIVQTKYVERDWGQINHTVTGIANQSITDMIIADIVARAANTYNNGIALTKINENNYSTSDGKTNITIEGIETINFQNAEGAMLKIGDQNVYIGGTSQYRLQPIKDKINEIILVEDKPMLINYKARLLRQIIQGGN